MERVTRFGLNDVDHEYAAKALADRVGIVLHAAYPSYTWMITGHPHPSRAFVDFELVEAGFMPVKGAHLGATVVLSDCATSAAFAATVRRLGGELLEMARLNRTHFDEAEFLARERNAYGLIVPDGYRG